MRRRRGSDPGGVPTHLRSFVPSDWDPEYVVARGKWIRARMSHFVANPDAWDGDVIAVLGAGANLRAREMRRRVPYPDLDEGHTV